MKYLPFIVLLVSCNIQQKPDYFEKAHEGFERSKMNVDIYLPGYCIGDSLSTEKLKLYRDSMSYWRGYEDAILISTE
jgi:hypothetical protein